MSAIIQVEGLSKRYRLGEKARHHSFRDKLADMAAAPFRAMKRIGSSRPEESPREHWALRDVSFSLKQGDVTGIIGRNGAGKSTLLKILSRITDPTWGRAEIRGRIGSLLEVGSGFHPELTGRENIFLNGAILGMKKAEIVRKFDEIVAFAEVEKFIDTAVKHYSSGMYLRLAFAVAAHLEPEILLVDEVLAVGDAAFQKKCLGKMSEVANAGRTIIFVSHSMSAIQALCTRGIVLSGGKLCYDGPIHDAVRYYLNTLEQSSIEPLTERKDRAGKGKVRLQSVEVSRSGAPGEALSTGCPAQFSFSVSGYLPNMNCSFTIYDHLGIPVVHFNSAQRSVTDTHYPMNGRARYVCEIPELPLLAGRYYINAALFGDNELQDHVTAAVYFNVEQGVLQGRAFGDNSGYGSVGVAHRWLTPVATAKGAGL
jgi:ABC-type polysaccharide/polyol phosphate transport system, ATPase component